MTMRNVRQWMVILGCVAAAPALASDWPSWRGPDQNGFSRENAPVMEWSPEGKNLLWKNDIGGRTTPIVLNGRVYTITPVGSGLNLQERVVCVDAETGKTIWEDRFNVFHTDMVENRVGWTALVADPETGNIYTHATGGEFICYNRDGKRLWTRSLTEEFGRISGYGGRLHTPFIDRDKVIISFLNSSWGPQAKPTHRWLALDKKSGEVIYWAAPGEAPLDTTYACPVVTVIDGKRMMIAPAADGWVYGMMVDTGEKVWGYKLSKRGLNTSPVVDGKYVYVTQSEENYGNSKMGSVLCIDGSKTGDITESGTVWRNDGYTVGYCSPTIRDGRLYVVTNDAELICFDGKDGSKIWSYDLGRVGKGSPVITADGVIYVGEQTGIFDILKDAGDKCTSLSTYEFPMRPEKGVDEFYGSPAIANGRVYFQVRSGMYCLGSGDSKTAAVADAAAAGDGDAQTALEPTLRIRPAEVTVHPGESVEYTADVVVPAGSGDQPDAGAIKLAAGGVAGSVSGTTFTAADAATYSAGKVSGKVAAPDCSGEARVRVIPKLPISVDFEDMKPGTVPPGWIGCGKKVTIDEHDGSKVLRKIADKKFPSPPFMRLKTYMTMPLETGYTVQCDLLSQAKKGRIKPDMGLVNARYDLVAVGMSKVLRVESWSAIPRLRVEVPFVYEPDTWYTMKFTVKPEGEQARLLGKIWPRDGAEPADWMIDTLDPCPNREGSAGLYAYSVGTTTKSDGPETYFDNVKVYRESEPRP